jgi:hypothetical protein
LDSLMSLFRCWWGAVTHRRGNGRSPIATRRALQADGAARNAAAADRR